MIGEITLGWPARALHPNHRAAHWSVKAAATKSARTNAAWATKQAGLSKLDLASLKATIVFYPPDNRRRDLDSLLSSMKAAIDGISDVVGVDDSSWQFTISKAEPVKHGAVKITLEVA